MRNHRKHTEQATTENQQLKMMLVDSVPVSRKPGSIGLSRNASPSSSQPSDGDYHSQQNRHYEMKPLPTLVEDPLDLTIVHEDSQTIMLENRTYETQMSASPSPSATPVPAQHASGKYKHQLSPYLIMPTVAQERRTTLQPMPSGTRGTQVVGIDLSEMSQSPSSSQAMTTPGNAAGIEDIKNASLYDLIKLQMQNQQNMMKKTTKAAASKSDRQSAASEAEKTTATKPAQRMSRQPSNNIVASNSSNLLQQHKTASTMLQVQQSQSDSLGAASKPYQQTRIKSMSMKQQTSHAKSSSRLNERIQNQLKEPSSALIKSQHHQPAVVEKKSLMHSNTSRSLIKNEQHPEDAISVNSSKHHHQRNKSKGRLRKNSSKLSSSGMKDLATVKDLQATIISDKGHAGVVKQTAQQATLITEKNHMTATSSILTKQVNSCTSSPQKQRPSVTGGNGSGAYTTLQKHRGQSKGKTGRQSQQVVAERAVGPIQTTTTAEMTITTSLQTEEDQLPAQSDLSKSDMRSQPDSRYSRQQFMTKKHQQKVVNMLAKPKSRGAERSPASKMVAGRSQGRVHAGAGSGAASTGKVRQSNHQEQQAKNGGNFSSFAAASLTTAKKMKKKYPHLIQSSEQPDIVSQASSSHHPVARRKTKSKATSTPQKQTKNPKVVAKAARPLEQPPASFSMKNQNPLKEQSIVESAVDEDEIIEVRSAAYQQVEEVRSNQDEVRQRANQSMTIVENEQISNSTAPQQPENSYARVPLVQQNGRRMVTPPQRVSRAERSRSRSQRALITMKKNINLPNHNQMQQHQSSQQDEGTTPISANGAVDTSDNAIEAYEGTSNNNVATEHRQQPPEQKRQEVEPAQLVDQEESIFVMSSSHANTEHCNTSLFEQKLLKPVQVQCQAAADKPLTMSQLAFDDDLSVIKQPSKVSFDEDPPQAQTQRETVLKTPDDQVFEQVDEEYLEIKRNKSRVEMFEDRLSVDDLRTERESTDLQMQLTSLEVPSATKAPKQLTEYQPSPIKPRNLRSQFQPQNSIKNILPQFSIKTIEDIVRIKKPQKSSQLIGQLLCMLLWVCKESSLPASTSDSLPKVPFQNLEDEFSSWENVQNYLNQNTVNVYQEVQQILQKFPLPRTFVDNYLLKMQHKMQVESRCLSRVTSQSFELAQSLVTASIDWHCKPTLGKFNYKPAGSRYTPLSSTGARNSVNATSQQNSVTINNFKDVSATESQQVSQQLTRSQNQFVEQNKKQLRNKYQKYRPGPKYGGTSGNSGTPIQQREESPTSQLRRQYGQQNHQFRSGPSNRLEDEVQPERRTFNHSFLNDSRWQSSSKAGTGGKQLDLSIHKTTSACIMTTQKNTNNFNSEQVELVRARTPIESFAAASPTSTEIAPQSQTTYSLVAGAGAGMAATVGANRSLHSTTTISSRNKMVPVRSVTHFSRQQMHSPGPQRPLMSNLSRPALITTNSTNTASIQADQHHLNSVAAPEPFKTHDHNDNELDSVDDEPINLVLENGVVSSRVVQSAITVPKKAPQIPPAAVSKTVEIPPAPMKQPSTKSRQALADRQLQQQKAKQQTAVIPSQIHQKDETMLPARKETTVVIEEKKEEVNEGRQRSSFAAKTETKTTTSSQALEQPKQQKPTIASSNSKPRTMSVFQKSSNSNNNEISLKNKSASTSLTPTPANAARQQKDEDNQYAIKVYESKRDPEQDWMKRDRDDFFCIEPTNVGDYYDHQDRLHEALIRPRARFAVSPQQQVRVQSPDQARQMIAAMREKLLKGNNLPASPATLTPAQPPAQVQDDEAEEQKQDEQHEDDQQQPQHQRQGTTGGGGGSGLQNLSYNEWQKRNFDNILQALQRDTTQSSRQSTGTAKDAADEEAVQQQQRTTVEKISRRESDEE